MLLYRAKNCRFLFIAVLLLLFYPTVSAQNICRDSSQINHYTYCQPVFRPVCGCDGQTYKNSCVATTQNGIMSFEDGPCEALAMDFNPNPVDDHIKLNVVRKDEGMVQVTLFDIYGKIFYSKYYGRIKSLSETIEVQDLPVGVYILTATTSTYGTWRKLVKQPLQ